MAESLGSLPLISSLRTLPAEKQGDIISLLFEPAPTLVALATPLLSSTNYDSYDGMIDNVGAAIEQLQRSGELGKLDDILSAHPRLGEKKVDSALSRAEQRSMAAASGGTESETATKEAKKLHELNQKYEETFPGLRYV
jgi:2-oxo-4-hydroxy-4-carboxy--5-ureidoimidazoline (OHCU) decarboxylase